jgi:hypothetical protein
MKKYKLKITPFLNTQLEPKDAKKYPLYYRVVYQRKSTMLKSIQNLYLADFQDEEMIEKEIQEITGLAQYLSEVFTEPMELTGLKLKYEQSQKEVIQILDEEIRKIISENLVKSSHPYAIGIRVGEYDEGYPITTLLEVISLVFEENEIEEILNGAERRITLYHFLDNAHGSQFKEKRLVEFLTFESFDMVFIKALRKKFDTEQSQVLYLDLIDILTQKLN